MKEVIIFNELDGEDKILRNVRVRDSETPRVFNGFVELYKFKVTIERVEESDETIIQRAEEVMASNKNSHNKSDLLRHIGNRFGDEARERVHSKW